MTQVNQPPVPTRYEVVQKILERNERGGEPPSGDDEPSLTGSQVADRLTRSGSRWADSNRNGKTELTYQFSNAAPAEFEEVRRANPDSKVKAFVPLSLKQREYVRQAQQEFADVANITFVEKKAGGRSEGRLTYSGYSTGDEGTAGRGFAYDPGSESRELRGTVWLRSLDDKSKFGEEGDAVETNIGDDAWRSAMIHELGHGLGLQHPFSDEHEQPELSDYAEDFNNYTVMSYNTPPLNKDLETVKPVSLMLDDMEAIQSIYGANHSTRNGDTTYGFNSNTDRDHYSLKTPEDKPLFSVWDGGGWDTLDFSEFSQNQTINLNAGSFSSVGGLHRNVSIANGVTIEEARGGTGKNNLIGNQAFNVLRGGPGSDTFYGGSGGAQMWGAGGANTFAFDTQSSGKANWVMDFVSGKDTLDFSGLRQRFGPLNFVSGLPVDHSKPQDPLNPTFISKPGDVMVSYDRDFQRTLFRLDTTGDGKMDMHIDVHGKVVRKDIVV